jgi:hypothetical protein
MKRTYEILRFNDEFHSETDGDYNEWFEQKWYSEEEIRKVIKMLAKEEQTESIDWEYSLNKELLGDEDKKIEELKSMLEDDKPLTLEEAKEKGYYTFSYENMDYKYKDENDIEHLFRDNKEICKGRDIYCYDNGDYSYEDENGVKHYGRNIYNKVW